VLGERARDDGLLVRDLALSAMSMSSRRAGRGGGRGRCKRLDGGDARDGWSRTCVGGFSSSARAGAGSTRAAQVGSTTGGGVSAVPSI
jgi:hypothetical protein